MAELTKFEDLFGKREERIDIIKPLIDLMNEFSDKQEYEKAKETLDKIKEELKTSNQAWISIANIQTIKDVYDLVTCDSIRLNQDDYKFSDFLALLVNVHERKDEIEKARERLRKYV